ncbi:MAG: hypothetical protein Ct9H300mP28_25520 [Pseudomonadota bacterium]|nr:MAG: hypothetical protein Ct9H300mP28_25520 [Pseudomonadota bacterium]
MLSEKGKKPDGSPDPLVLKGLVEIHTQKHLVIFQRGMMKITGFPAWKFGWNYLLPVRSVTLPPAIGPMPFFLEMKFG